MTTEPTTDELARWAHEGCREWIKNTHDAPDRCGLPSVVILWGKLFDPEALGPRCEDHAAKWLNGRLSQHDVSQSAVFDLRPITRLLALVAAQADQIAGLRAALDVAETQANNHAEDAILLERAVKRVRALCDEIKRGERGTGAGLGLVANWFRAALDGTEATP